MSSETTIHCFEAAGLGKAPFRYLGSYEDRGPKVFPGAGGVTVMVGSPGQPMGTCKYCGQGIAICCRIKSADGKEFIVGSDCVMKTGDAGLRKMVQAEKTELRHKREAKQIADGKAFIESYRDRLCDHRFTPGSPHTIMGSFDWYMMNAGNAGKIKIIRAIKKYIKDTFGEVEK